MKNIDQMVPVLHHNNTGSVNIKNFNRRQKWNFFLTSLTINNWFKTNGRSYNYIWSIKVWKVDNFFLFGKDFDSNSEEIVLIILIFFYFLLVFNHPLIKISSFLFLSFRLILNLLNLSWFLIFHELLFNLFKDGLSITNIGSNNEIFSISKSFSFFVFFQGFDTTFLMLIHVGNDNFSEFFNCLFLIVFYMNIINVTVNDLLCCLIFIRFLDLLLSNLFFNFRRWFC